MVNGSHTITVTGHRIVYRDDVTSAMLRRAFFDFARSRFVEHGMVTVNIGMAIGTDQICAQCCVDNPELFRFVAYIPCAEQESRWPRPTQENYHRLLKRAHDVVQVSTEPYSPGCMRVRNKAMVDNCDEVWAYFDKNAGGNSKGTQDCLDYARRVGKPVTIWKPNGTI